MTMSNMAKVMASISRDEPVFVYPNDDREKSYVGRFFVANKVNFSFFLGLEFEFKKNLGKQGWFYTERQGNVSLPKQDFFSGKYKLFIGEKDVLQAMSRMENYNIGLASRLMDLHRV
jgi:hypothetical protein